MHSSITVGVQRWRCLEGVLALKSPLEDRVPETMDTADHGYGSSTPTPIVAGDQSHPNSYKSKNFQYLYNQKNMIGKRTFFRKMLFNLPNVEKNVVTVVCHFTVNVVWKTNHCDLYKYCYSCPSIGFFFFCNRLYFAKIKSVSFITCNCMTRSYLTAYKKNIYIWPFYQIHYHMHIRDKNPIHILYIYIYTYLLFHTCKHILY